MNITGKLSAANKEALKDYPKGYFKKIKDWEHYLVGKTGEIFNTRTNRFKKSHKDTKGYMRVGLADAVKGRSTKKVHRLVAKAFLATYSEQLQVNHKNCIKHDNRLANLEMVTRSENIKHAWENGRMKLTKRDGKGRFCK